MPLGVLDRQGELVFFSQNPFSLQMHLCVDVGGARDSLEAKMEEQKGCSKSFLGGRCTYFNASFSLSSSGYSGLCVFSKGNPKTTISS